MFAKFRLQLIIFFIINPINGANIIFDLDGVLLRKSNIATIWEVGLSNLVGFYNPFSLEKRLFDFLNTVLPRNAETPFATHNNILLPQIVCDWLSGLKTSAKIRELIEQKIKENKTFFASKAERNLIWEIANMMFTPDRMARTIKRVKRGLKLLKRCYDQKDESGRRIHKIYLLSNWDSESFQIIAQYNRDFQKILALCDGFIISGDAHLIKPDPMIFAYLFEEYNINPDLQITVYIDDQETNINAAKTLQKKQFYPLLCKNYTFKPVKKILRELNII